MQDFKISLRQRRDKASRRRGKTIIAIVIVCLVVLGGFLFWQSDLWQSGDTTIQQDSDVVVEQELVSSSSSESSVVAKEEEKEEVVDVPVEHYLDVPFTSQAPHANWDLPYQEACEEASILMVHYFHKGKELNPDLADAKILDIVAAEEEMFGYYKDTTAKETAQFIREY